MDNRQDIIKPQPNPPAQTPSPAATTASAMPTPTKPTVVKTHTRKPIFATIVVIILFLGGVYGTYYWQHQKVTELTTQVSTLQLQVNGLEQAKAKQSTPANTSTTSPTTSTSTGVYAGWETYTLKQEKLTFKYPSTWKLKDMTDSDNDDEILTGPNNFSMIVGAGAAVSAVNIPSGPIELADPLTFNTKTAYFDALSSTTSTSGNVYEVFLSQSKTEANDFFPTKNISFNASNSRILVSINYWGSNTNSPNTEPLSYVEGDANYKDAKLVVSSMAY